VIVRPGDNLSSIAARYGKTWQQLYAIPANRQVIGSNPNLIKPGQRLVIP
jgi:LysM repeat protein